MPVIAPNMELALEYVYAADKHYQMIEIWLDYIQDLDKEGLEEILDGIGKRIALFLFRTQDFSTPRLELRSQQEILNWLPSSAWVDFDIYNQSELLNWCKTNRPELFQIISYHNYDTTPEIEKLREIAQEMRNLNAGIIKFSTFCQSEADALRLMSFLLELKNKERSVVLGMGKFGVPLRIVGPLWGSEIAYAPQSITKSSAPGQLTLSQLSSMLKELNVS
jgi:3-dehydroquinate dehydratase I